MKLLVFGHTGQVARALRAREGCARIEALERGDADLEDPVACAARVAETDADAVVVAAAYTAVDRAEEEEALAHRVNALAPGAIAEAAARRRLPLVHISTDYVFDGTGTDPFNPRDPTGPLGAYGRTKLAGEEAVRAAGGVHAILRTSWVVSPHGTNFVRTMLRLGAERDRIGVVADQVGGPTPAAAIAELCLRAAARLGLEPGLTGTYHFSGAPDTTWAGLAREIFARAGLRCEVDEIATADWPTPARRPLNSRLDCADTERAFGLARPDWREGLDRILAVIRSDG